MYPKRESSGVFVYPPLETLSGKVDIDLETECGHSRENALYVHIPFCKSFCTFCSFFKAIKRDEKSTEQYLDALKKEIKMYAETPYIKSLEFGAVYFGGGTPTCLTTGQLENLLRYCQEKFHLSKDVQITVEGNASTLDKEKLSGIFDNGCNRISIGVQTFNSNIGKILNLPHSNSQVFETLKEARKIGYKNISIDLIYNLPGETLEIWENDLKIAIDLGVDHISTFCLHIYPGTMLSKQLENNEIPPVGSQDEAIEMYKMAIRILTGAGYIQESLTDFVKPRVEGYKYGRLRAECSDVLAVGVGANGYLNHYIYRNLRPMRDYIQTIESRQFPLSVAQPISIEEEMHGFMVKGLRHLEVKKKEFRKRFNREIENVFTDILAKLKQNGLVEINNESIKLTYLGTIWGGNVCREFYSHRIKTLLAEIGEAIC